MCAIFGYAGRATDKARLSSLVQALAVYSQSRGVDATGFAALHPSGHLMYEKAPEDADTFLKRHMFHTAIAIGAPLFIGHTRYTTSGDAANNENNHPHFDAARRFAIVHNGHIFAHDSLARANHFPISTECDSEVIAHLIADKLGKLSLPDSKRAVATAAETLDDWNGSFAVAALDRIRRGIWLVRNSVSPTHYLFIPSLGVTLFASTAEILWQAVCWAYNKKERRAIGLRIQNIQSLDPGRVMFLPTTGSAIFGSRMAKIYTGQRSLVGYTTPKNQDWYGADDWWYHSGSNGTSDIPNHKYQPPIRVIQTKGGPK